MISPEAFQAFKISLVDDTGLAKDALHVHIGLAIFILVRLCWRWRGGWAVAWVVALAAAAGGEWLDIKAELGGGALQPDVGHWHDLWNTMLWPSVLLCVGWWLQPRHTPAADPRHAQPTASGGDAEHPFDEGGEQPVEQG